MTPAQTPTSFWTALIARGCGRLAVLCAALLLATGCVASDDAAETTEPGDETRDEVTETPTPDAETLCGETACETIGQPAWASADRWYVASLYRLGQARMPEWIEALSRVEGSDLVTGELQPPSGWEPSPDESWGAPIIWEFTVLATGLDATGESDFSEYATTANGESQTVTVLRVTAPKELNAPDIIERLDPTFYVVFGDVDGQARAAHFNYKVNGGRNTFVLEFPADSAGYDLSAAHDMFVVPYLMPAFPLVRADHATVVGGGTAREEMVVTDDGDGVIVTFNTEPDGRVVQQRWSDAAPFFDVSATPERISWRVEPSSLPGGLVTAPLRMEAEETIASKFRSPIRLKQAYAVQAGEFASQVPNEFEPWAGYWWPLRQAPTAFGWSDGDRSQSQSDPAIELRDLVRDDLGRLDDLGTELRELDRSSDEWDTKRDEYFRLRNEISDRVWEFTSDPETGIAARFTRGEIDLTDADDFGPLTKLGMYLMANKLSDHPFEGLAWEVIKQYNPNGESWWGKCNGWAAAAVLTNEPRETLTLPLPGDAFGIEAGDDGDTPSIDLEFEPGDVKALISGAYYGVVSHFFGSRYSGEEDDLADLHPDAFHRLITYYIGEEKFPLAFDTTATEAVWNYPAYAYTSTIEDLGVVDEGTRSINRATRGQIAAIDGIEDKVADEIVSFRSREGRIDELQELTSIEAVTPEVLDLLTAAFSPDGEQHRLSVTTDLVFSTDGVSEDHVDNEDGDPVGFTNTYTYDLFVDSRGRVIGGVWTGSSVENHPDFAWLPYANNPRPASEYNGQDIERVRQRNYFGYYAPSENPFIFTDVMERLVSVRVNAPVVCNPDPDDCPTGFTCNPEDGSCVASETPSECAGGESRDNAESLTGDASLTDVVVCPGRDSWFSLSVPSGGELLVELGFSHSDGDIDLEVFGPDGEMLGSSASIQDRETVSAQNLAGGDYLIRVYGYDGAGNTITLNAMASEAPAGGDSCGDADIEPNERIADAADLPEAGIGAAICEPGDADFYQIPADAGDVVVTLEFLHATGDLDLKALDADGQVIGSSASVSDSESVDARGGDFIQVYGYRDATGSYQLSFEAR